MRAQQFITEAVAEDYLYHTTGLPSAIQIWRDDWLRGGTGPSFGKNRFGGASTTRNYGYALGYLRKEGDRGGVIFWLNQQLIRQDLGRRRLRGYDWFTDNDPDDVRDDFQRRSEMDDTDRFETVITQGGLQPFRKYVSKIQVWLPRTSDLLPLPPGEYYRTHDPKNPDQWQTNIRVNSELMTNNWLKDPMNAKAWAAMQQDPRTKIENQLGVPKKYQGKGIDSKRQYDQDHPMYRYPR